MSPVPPGGTLGIVGGGQLGRMLAIAAANLGYRTHIYAPEAGGPAKDVAAEWTQAAYDDAAALARFAAAVDAITYEFENVPVAPLAALGDRVRPGVRALEAAQDRLTEKRFVADLAAARGLSVQPAAWQAVNDRASLDAGLARLACPAILKTRRFGYDGKGQARIASPDEANAAWRDLGAGGPLILEAFVRFEREFSILLVRGADGTIACWDAPENVHEGGILRRSTVPADTSITAQVAEAGALAEAIAAELDYVGVLACEFFATADGAVFNEMAPRVHNSGHWTIEGAVTSQFENHVRAVLGLPLGSTALAARGAEMTNLIGADADGWADLLADPAAKLHLYGKREARPGRKMGHVTRVTR